MNNFKQKQVSVRLDGIVPNIVTTYKSSSLLVDLTSRNKYVSYDILLVCMVIMIFMASRFIRTGLSGGT